MKLTTENCLVGCGYAELKNEFAYFGFGKEINSFFKKNYTKANKIKKNWISLGRCIFQALVNEYKYFYYFILFFLSWKPLSITLGAFLLNQMTN